MCDPNISSLNHNPTISVSCICGKVLHVSSKYAGKCGRCPQCHRMFKLTEVVDIEERICPTCGAYIASDRNICISCQTDLNTGEWKEKISVHHFSLSHRIILQSLMWSYIIGSLAVALLWWIKPRPKPLAPDIVQTWQSIEKEASAHENPIVVWLLLELEMRHLGSKCPATIPPKIAEAQRQITHIFRAHEGELGQLIQERRLLEIVSRATPQLLEVMGKKWDFLHPSVELSQSWNALLRLYREISLEIGGMSSPEQFIHDQLQLDYYRKQFSRYLEKFEQWTYAREYDLAQIEMENLWESLHSLENIDTEDSIIVAVRKKLKEVQSIKTLFSIAHEGAKMGVKGLTELSVKNDGKIQGTIQYALGYFTVMTTANKKIQISLKKLHAQDVVMFALNVEKNKYVYEYAGIFYFYEREFGLAKDSFLLAQQYGAESREIEYYLNRIAEEKTKFPK